MEERLLQRMIHAIGLDNGKQYEHVYEAYRNGSYYNEPVEEWELLVVGGYAERTDHNEREITYHCTKKGLKAIADATGLIIRYTIEVEPSKQSPTKGTLAVMKNNTGKIPRSFNPEIRWAFEDDFLKEVTLRESQARKSTTEAIMDMVARDVKEWEKNTVFDILHHHIDNPIEGEITREKVKAAGVLSVVYDAEMGGVTRFDTVHDGKDFRIEATSALIGVAQGDYLIAQGGLRRPLTKKEKEYLKSLEDEENGKAEKNDQQGL